MLLLNTAAAALACACISAAGASAVVPPAPVPVPLPRVVVSPVTTVTAPAPPLGSYWVFLDSSTVKEGVEVCSAVTRYAHSYDMGVLKEHVRCQHC